MTNAEYKAKKAQREAPKEPISAPALPPPDPVLIVIRKMASAAHVLCQLKGTETKDLVCDVRVSENFRKGMEIPGAKAQPQHNSRAWKYFGKLPRVPGRW